MIHDSFLRLFKRLQRPPSQHEIASDCGLSRTTIQRHVKKTGITDFAPNFKLRAERVLHGITNSAEEGNVAAARLYFELVFGWNPDANDNGDRDFKVKVTFE